MHYVFYMLGLLAVIAGLAWAGLLLARGGFSLGVILATAPAAATLLAGLLLLGIGAALEALHRIARNTADTADAVESLLRAKAAD